MSAGTSLYLAYPYSRPHPDKFLQSVTYLGAAGGFGEMQIGKVYGFSLDTARNALVDGFIKSGMDFMLCVDNDAWFSPEAVNRLMAHNLPMVCGCMYTRSLPPKPTVGHYVGQAKNGTHIYRYAEVVQRILGLADRHGVTYENAENNMVFPQTAEDLIEIDGCGMHFALIRRDVIETLQPPYFVFMGSTTAGEDYYFCRKVKAAGFPIYLDLSVQTGHIDSEDHDYGIKELLYLTQYIPLANLMDVDSWEIGN